MVAIALRFNFLLCGSFFLMIDTNYHDIKQVCCILNSIFSVHIPSMDESYKVGCYLKLFNNLKSFQLFFI